MSTAEDLSNRLAARLRELWRTPVEVTGMRQLTAGASRETWSADAQLPGGDTRPLIVRRDPEGLPRPEQMAVEAAAFTAARAAGVPEPALYDHHDNVMGTPHLLMARLDGETIPRRLLREHTYAGARRHLARELGGILARIHHIEPAAIPGLSRLDALPELTAIYQELGEPRPAIELGLRWLTEHRPPPGGDAVVHGDFRTGNLLIGPDGVRGVLDWELAHRGDPMTDLGWLCTKAWRFGSPHPAGGFGSREELLDGYAAQGGTPPDPETLHWWEVHGTVRWALLCRKQAERHLSGTEPSVELAVLGRKVCESEHDILLTLGLAEPSTVADPLDDEPRTTPEPHDLPGAAGLLHAVGDFLGEITTKQTGEPDPRRSFHARVAANALRIARRELLLGTEHAKAHRTRLAALGCANDLELCRAVRTAALDDYHDEVVATIRNAVRDKLVVANPGHLAIPG